ncbi:MAG: HAD hydrolase-like protein [Clostridia bacterium]|nr:HAD hydrolase-like protein [Clostridia bacterium]
MSGHLAQYEKKKEFLVCVDSDGCAMDTMDVKHFRCFGPCMVAEWGLEEHADAILARWNDINLYTMTRGINRFKGLAIALTEINAQYAPIEDLASFTAWAEASPELSNDALSRAISANPGSVCMKKALSWSRAVNASITKLPNGLKLPFPMAREALAYAHERVDVAIVSSANPDAVIEEWALHGLLPHTDIVLAQDAGSKAYCIAELMKKGYAPDHILMCGDAPGDLDAAKKNGVFYYPILVRRERESWEEFIASGLDRLLRGEYAGTYQQEKIAAFLRNLGAEA